MLVIEKNYYVNKTASYFSKASKLLTIGGLPGYITWEESGYRRVIYKYIQKMITVGLFVFIATEMCAFVTQKNLTEKQAADLWIFTIAHPFLISFPHIVQYHKDKMKDVILKLCITLKTVYNDPDVERQMIRKTAFYSIAFCLNIISALVSYGFAGLMQVIQSEGTFLTVITAWPEATNTSVLASCIRVLAYLTWWIFMIRVSAAFILLINTMGCLCYQYKNLQSYFYSLNDIFDVKESREHTHAEVKYEEALKFGFKLHTETLWCTRQCQMVCSVAYSGQITQNVFVFSMLLLQMTQSERTLAGTFTIILTGAALLYSTGILMWNAGDVTIEAALVPTAMYSSGWQNCTGKCSERVRKLLVIAMTEGQRHIAIKCFGIMDISYQAYVSMVKTSYSAFSLLY